MLAHRSHQRPVATGNQTRLARSSTELSGSSAELASQPLRASAEDPDAAQAYTCKFNVD